MNDFIALFNQVVLNSTLFVDFIIYFQWGFMWFRMLVIASLLFIMTIRIFYRLMGRNVH